MGRRPSVETPPPTVRSGLVPAMTGEAARDAFLDWLEQERHAAANTVEAYSHALTGFLGFLTNHLGGEPDLDSLSKVAGSGYQGMAGGVGE